MFNPRGCAIRPPEGVASKSYRKAQALLKRYFEAIALACNKERFLKAWLLVCCDGDGNGIHSKVIFLCYPGEPIWRHTWRAAICIGSRWSCHRSGAQKILSKNYLFNIIIRVSESKPCIGLSYLCVHLTLKWLDHPIPPWPKVVLVGSVAMLVEWSVCSRSDISCSGLGLWLVPHELSA